MPGAYTAPVPAAVVSKISPEKVADTGGLYVALENGDYQYVPEQLDRHSLIALTQPAPDIAVIAKFCQPGTVAIDIGANIGQWSLPMAKAVGSTGRLLAFEPVPFLHDVLDKTFRINGLGQATAFKVALSNRIGKRPFFVNISNNAIVDSGLSSLEHQAASAVPIEVETTTLDTCSSSQRLANRISFIKIDVEGHEYAVLEGAKETLAKYKPALLMESGHEDEAHRDMIFRFLSGLGYEPAGIVFERFVQPFECDLPFGCRTSGKGALYQPAAVAQGIGHHADQAVDGRFTWTSGFREAVSPDERSARSGFAPATGPVADEIRPEAAATSRNADPTLTVDG